MEVDQPDDEGAAHGGPPPPGDRPWRHPSELTAQARGVGTPARRPPRWLIAVTSGLSVGVLAVAVVAAVGGLGRPTKGREPAADVAPATAALLTVNEVSQAWLGIVGVDLDQSGAARLGATPGATVRSVLPDSPAARGGMASGDVVVAVDGARVNNMAELSLAVRRHRPGEPVSLEVVRQGRRHDAQVVLGERPPGS